MDTAALLAAALTSPPGDPRGDAATWGRGLAEAAGGDHVAWAAHVLQVAAADTRTAVPPSVTAALVLAADPHRWASGHAVFGQVRDDLLAHERAPRHSSPDPDPDIAEEALLFLAELVCQLAYNATCPTDPFDADTASWVAVNAVAIVHTLDDPAPLIAAIGNQR